MPYANELNRLVLEMVKLRNRIDGMDYNDPTYDKLEEELHDIEDEFVDEYGEILEDALEDIYEKYCPQLD
ncbi:MAG: hypothetical protein JJT94_11165, partial [Bernardetiaceae bacterium]|nr:hypothetical protein [Bernardetiaceae bacterium]